MRFFEICVFFLRFSKVFKVLALKQKRHNSENCFSPGSAATSIWFGPPQQHYNTKANVLRVSVFVFLVFSASFYMVRFSPATL